MFPWGKMHQWGVNCAAVSLFLWELADAWAIEWFAVVALVSGYVAGSFAYLLKWL